ncbi:hypothetical protein OIY81_3041 [Cryptosporidium canis]|nr:hypothetical protein OIY81_3041 [Cryptosporidium canis]
MVSLHQSLKTHVLACIIFLTVLIFFNGPTSEASSPKQKKDLKSVKFVQRGTPAYVTSSNPGSYFRHIQTTVEQESSSSSDEAPEKEASPSRAARQKYRFVHAPVGYEKSNEPLLAEIQSLKESNEKLSAEIKLLNQKIKVLTAENKSLKEQLDHDSKKSDSAKQKVSSLQDELKKKDKQYSALITSMSQKDRDISEKNERITVLEERLQEKEGALEARERSISELEARLSEKTQDIQRREEEAARAAELLESMESKNSEVVGSLTSEKDSLAAIRASLEEDKRQLEDKLQRAISERDEARKSLENCLESLDEEKKRQESQKPGADAGQRDDKKKLFDAVLKQMTRQKKTKWVKASPLRRPEGAPGEAHHETEISKVFAAMKSKKEADLQDFIMEFGLQNEDRRAIEEKYRRYKERNVPPSPKGIKQFDRFKKEEEAE